MPVNGLAFRIGDVARLASDPNDPSLIYPIMAQRAPAEQAASDAQSRRIAGLEDFNQTTGADLRNNPLPGVHYVRGGPELPNPYTMPRHPAVEPDYNGGGNDDEGVGGPEKSAGEPAGLPALPPGFTLDAPANDLPPLPPGFKLDAPTNEHKVGKDGVPELLRRENNNKSLPLRAGASGVQPTDDGVPALLRRDPLVPSNGRAPTDSERLMNSAGKDFANAMDRTDLGAFIPLGAAAGKALVAAPGLAIDALKSPQVADYAQRKGVGGMAYDAADALGHGIVELSGAGAQARLHGRGDLVGTPTDETYDPNIDAAGLVAGAMLFPQTRSANMLSPAEAVGSYAKHALGNLTMGASDVPGALINGLRATPRLASKARSLLLKRAPQAAAEVAQEAPQAAPQAFSQPAAPPSRNGLAQNWDRVVGAGVGGTLGGAGPALADPGDGNGDGGPNVAGAAEGAIMGAVAPRAALTAAKRVIRGVEGAGARLAGGDALNSFNEKVAARAVRKSLTGNGLRTVQDAADTATARFGDKPASVADLTQEGIGTTAGLARLPGQTGEAARNRYEDLLQERPGRLFEDVHKTTGVDPETVTANMDQAISDASKEISPEYERMFAANPTLNSERLTQLAQDPVVRSYLGQAVRASKSLATTAGQPYSEARVWDLTKRGLDQAISKQFRASGSASPELLAARDAVRGELDNLIPEYQGVRDNAMAPRMKAARAEGKGVLSGKLSVERIKQRASELTGQPLTAFQAGAIEQMVPMIENSRNVMSALTSPAVEQKLSSVFGEDAAKELTARMRADYTITQNAGRINPNVGSVTSQAQMGGGFGRAIAKGIDLIRKPASLIDTGLSMMRDLGYSKAQRDLMGEMFLSEPTEENLARIFRTKPAGPPAGSGGRSRLAGNGLAAGAQTEADARQASPPNRNGLASIGGPGVAGAIGGAFTPLPDADYNGDGKVDMTDRVLARAAAIGGGALVGKGPAIMRGVSRLVPKNGLAAKLSDLAGPSAEMTDAELRSRFGLHPEEIADLRRNAPPPVAPDTRPPPDRMGMGGVRPASRIDDSEITRAAAALNPQEFEAFKAANEGLTTSQIAERLGGDNGMTTERAQHLLTQVRQKGFSVPGAAIGRPASLAVDIQRLLDQGKSSSEIIDRLGRDNANSIKATISRLKSKAAADRLAANPPAQNGFGVSSRAAPAPDPDIDPRLEEIFKTLDENATPQSLDQQILAYANAGQTPPTFKMFRMPDGRVIAWDQNVASHNEARDILGLGKQPLEHGAYVYGREFNSPGMWYGGSGVPPAPNMLDYDYRRQLATQGVTRDPGFGSSFNVGGHDVQVRIGDTPGGGGQGQAYLTIDGQMRKPDTGAMEGLGNQVETFKKAFSVLERDAIQSNRPVITFEGATSGNNSLYRSALERLGAPRGYVGIVAPDGSQFALVRQDYYERLASEGKIGAGMRIVRNREGAGPVPDWQRRTGLFAVPAAIGGAGLADTILGQQNAPAR